MLDLIATSLAVALTGVPAGAVATVDGEPIAKRTYRHWMRVAAKADEHTSLASRRRQTMKFLIHNEWLDHEAAERGIAVADEEVRRSFQEQKAQAFTNERDYRRFLRDSGQTTADILVVIRYRMLSDRIRDQVVAGAAPVTDAQIAEYYNRHRQRFVDPERRDLRIVLTKRRAEARRAKRALQAGRSWKAVVRRFSIDRGSRRRGGRLPSLAKGAGVPELNRAAFRARKGALVGPVKSRFGYYVFEVTKITPARQRSLEEVRPALREQLEARSEERAVATFTKAFRAKWSARTECRRGYVVEECGA